VLTQKGLFLKKILEAGKEDLPCWYYNEQLMLLPQWVNAIWNRSSGAPGVGEELIAFSNL
jgi:hypothetical protein